MPFPLLLAGSELLSLYETLKGQSELNKLHEQAVPTYGETPEMAASRARAEGLARSGYTPAETAAFRKNIAEDINTKSRQALDLGGGSLARTIGGIGKIDSMGAESKFAANDAALHRQNIHYADKFSQAVQSIADRNIAEQLKQRYAAEQALGGAVQTGLSGLASTLNLAQITGAGGGFGKSSTGAPPQSSVYGNYSPTGTGSYFAPTAEAASGEAGTTQPSEDRIKQVLAMLQLSK